MTKAKSDDDPKKLLRCPGGCGNVADFLSLAKCVLCGNVRCSRCLKKYKQRPYCKACHKEQQRQGSRKTSEKGAANG